MGEEKKKCLLGWELFDLNLRCCLLLHGRSKAAHTAGSRGAVSHGGALSHGAWGLYTGTQSSVGTAPEHPRV